MWYIDAFPQAVRNFDVPPARTEYLLEAQNRSMPLEICMLLPLLVRGWDLVYTDERRIWCFKIFSCLQLDIFLDMRKC